MNDAKTIMKNIAEFHKATTVSAKRFIEIWKEVFQVSNNTIHTYTYDELKHETDMAWLLIFDGEEIWLPKSECKICEQDNEIDVPEWLAIKKGLE